MDALTRGDLRALMNARDGWRVSIYMPTHNTGADWQQNAIRFKNLVRDAGRLLSDAELRPAEVHKLLDPARRLMAEEGFWKRQSRGLVVFLNSDKFRYFRLPLDFEELVIATHGYHVKPLLPLFTSSSRFFLLALNKENVEVYQCSPFSLRKTEVPGLVKTIDEALHEEPPQNPLHGHASAPAAMGKKGIVVHGTGFTVDFEKDKVLRFYRLVDKALVGLLWEEREPLVLAGAEYLLPIYRKANSYPHLADEGIPSDPGGLSHEALRDRGWAIVEPVYLRRQELALEQCKQLAGTGRASSDIRLIVPAARHGKVDTLIAALHEVLWGRCGGLPDEVIVHPDEEPGDEDLLSCATADTLLHRGAAYAVDRARMPEGAPVAAILRM